MTILILILHVIVSLVLIAVILLQAGKGGGLSETFGGASQQLFGTKSTTFLNRATAICAIFFLITCLSLGILSGRGRRSLLERVRPEAPTATVPEEPPSAPPSTPQGADEQTPNQTDQTSQPAP